MKVLYRPVRSTLAESMREVVSFDSLKDLFFYLVGKSEGNLTVNDLAVSYYSYDKRIGWDTYVIVVKRFGIDNYVEKYGCYQAYGWCTFK